MGRGYFSVIPAPVLDAPVPDKAKLLYAEISALAEDTGYCWASNSSLSERLNCSERTISRGISQLSEIGVIRVSTIPRADRAGGKERQIFVGAFVQNGVDKNGETSAGVDKNGETGHDKNGETILNKLSKTVRDIPPISPTESEKKKRDPSRPAWKPERFEAFYDFYRRKVMPPKRYPSRMDAVKAWDKLRPDDATIDAIAKAIRVQMQSEDWKRGIGIPDPCRYLSHRRWEDAGEAEEQEERMPRYVGMKRLEDGTEVAIYE